MLPRTKRILVILGTGGCLIAFELLAISEFHRAMKRMADGMGTATQRAAGLVEVVSAAERLSQSAHTKPGDRACRYTNSREGLSGYESGGPYTLDHFRLTKGRTELREFMWKHWHHHLRGIAEARVRTVDRGTVKVLFLIQPDAHGSWGIEVELDRPMDPPCVTFHVDSLVRVPIANPDEDYPSQTLGSWPPDKIPPNRLADFAVVDPKRYRVVLVRDGKSACCDF